MLNAWLVHLYTASGALFAFLALNRIFYDRYRDAFFWLFVAVIVDATDGMLARRTDVASRLSWFDGAKLDDIVDYLTYVFVPAFFVWHALLVPDRWSTILVAAILLSSAYGFNRGDAKTADGFFTGFPSYWNIVVFYLYLSGWSPEVNGAILATLVVLVFVPMRYVHPSRAAAWRLPTMGLGAMWTLLMGAMLWQMPTVSPTFFWASFIFPAYYVTISVVLHVKHRGELSAMRRTNS
jgi:phosphatidylcholine synthase